MASKDFDKLKQLNAELINLGGSSLATLLAGKQDAMTAASWTPTLTASGGGTIDYLLNTGQYFKIGRLVVAFFTIQVNTLIGPSGNIRLSGLPVAVNNEANGFFASGIITGANGWATNNPSTVRGIPNTTTATLGYRTTANGVITTETAAADITSTSRIEGVLIYRSVP